MNRKITAPKKPIYHKNANVTNNRKVGIISRIITSLIPNLFALALWLYFIIRIFRYASSLVSSSSSSSFSKSNANELREPLLPVYQFPNSMPEPHFLSQVNPSLLKPVSTSLFNESQLEHYNVTFSHNNETSIVNISTAHKLGLIHIGNSMYIVDAKDKLLFLKRSPSLVLCPSTWSLCGEHHSLEDLKNSSNGHDFNQMFHNIVLRGIKEELGITSLQYISDIQPLTKYPVYFRRDYSSKRMDRQLTSLMYVRFNTSYNKIPLLYDDEVSDYKWVSLKQARAFVETHEFCHGFMHALFEVGLGALLQSFAIDSETF